MSRRRESTSPQAQRLLQAFLLCPFERSPIKDLHAGSVEQQTEKVKFDMKLMING
jgi:hypothetical protein